MNLLFVNYGDFTTNSLNHIGGFANWLAAAGHACVVAVPDGADTLRVVHAPRFQAATFADVLAAEGRLFPDGRPAALLHAWTPRESVRKFILAHQRLSPATRVVVHLEDNEEHLLAAFAKQPTAELRGLADDELQARLPAALSHPRRYRNLLHVADGATVITGRLREFVPAPVPTHLLPPGVDFDLYSPRAAGAELRRDLGLSPADKVVVYAGSTTFANQAEIRELLRAIHRLDRPERPVRLVRTGFHPAEFFAACDFDWKRFTVDAGFVEKARLPALLALADVLVQPGRPGAFDDYRLPSKLPEFLAMGRPVVLPACNLGTVLRDGEEALVLRDGSAGEIALRCEQVFADPALAARLGGNGAAFARRHFDLAQIGPALLKFYESVLASSARADWPILAAGPVTESSLLPGLTRAAFAALLPANHPQRAASLALFDDLAQAMVRAESAAARGLAAELQHRFEARIDELAAREKLTAEHAANLAESLHQTRRGLAELKCASDRRIRELELRAEQLQRQAHNFQAELVRVSAEEERLAEKVRRMQASFSWKATAPLRALRRRFLDRPAAPPPPASTPAATAPTPRYHLDEPACWHLPAGPLVIRGWCLLPDGSPATQIRARYLGQTVTGLARQPRPDVSAAQGSEAAGHSGFTLNLLLEAGRHPLHLEVADAAGNWQPLLQTVVRAFKPVNPARDISYQHWLHLYEKTDGAPPADGPLVSVLMPVYNTPEKWLRRALESVREQTYRHWELCIANDASTAAHVRPLLDEAARADPRIKVVHRESNGHISRASNSALDLATGEFTALLDHDDELAPHALAEVVRALAARPDADLLYSDEDKVDEQGRRFDPYFKPDFLPDLFRAQNYLTHLAVYRTALLRRVGGFRAGFEGSQDWDLALRVSEQTTPARIVHIPRILYHWRAIPGSTALTLDQKHYHVAAARRALEEHLVRTGRTAALEPVAGDHWRVRYALPEPPPLVSIIMPTRNGVRHLRRCLDSLLARTTYPNYEVVIVDNGSDDPATLAFLQEAASARVRVLPWPHPFNYSAINNFAVRAAAGELVALLNDDLEVITPGWLEEMAAQALRPEIGCVGAMLYYPDDTLQHAGVVLGVGGPGGVGGVAGHAFKKFPRHTEGAFNRARLAQNYSAVTAACLVVRKTVYEQVGGLDEQALAIAFNDVDFCLKVRATGLWNLWTPFAEFYHHESASRGPEDTPAKQTRFRGEIETMLARWGPLLRADPAYNPNLTHETEDFALAWPPREADRMGGELARATSSARVAPASRPPASESSG
ncbi:MAG: glycosyltransferase [Verrucomicrobiota bacterium]